MILHSTTQKAVVHTEPWTCPKYRRNATRFRSSWNDPLRTWSINHFVDLKNHSLFVGSCSTERWRQEMNKCIKNCAKVLIRTFNYWLVGVLGLFHPQLSEALQNKQDMLHHVLDQEMKFSLGNLSWKLVLNSSFLGFKATTTTLTQGMKSKVVEFQGFDHPHLLLNLEKSVQKPWPISMSNGPTLTSKTYKHLRWMIGKVLQT